MSLKSVADSAKAAKQNARARKGDIAVFEVRASSTDRNLRRVEYSRGYIVGVVTSATRDGIVKTVQTHSGVFDFTRKGTHRPAIGLHSKANIPDIDGALIAQACNAYYDSTDEAVLAICTAICTAINGFRAET